MRLSLKANLASGVSSSRLVFILHCLLLIGIADMGVPTAAAQESHEHSIEGYISRVGSPSDSKGSEAPGDFDVNGQHVVLSGTTSYGLIAAKSADAEDVSGSLPSKDDLRVGVYVRVTGPADHEKGMPKKTMDATSVLFRKDWARRLTGFGVVERVTTNAGEPVFVADGYRIRVGAGAEVSFGGNLKTLADVGPNTWVAYKGKRDSQGILIASSLKFVPSARPAPRWLIPKPKTDPVQWVVPADGALINEDGVMKGPHDKVRLNDEGGWWHFAVGENALQARVLRIGQALIPAYQKQLADSDSSRINFRFYAIDDGKTRSDVFCNQGLVMIPVQVLSRLENDDQIAAVLADGIAFQMQLQSARNIAKSREILGTAIVASVALPAIVSPLGAYGVAAIVDHERNMKMEEQRGRIALGLMADAGFDPRQAPEAWRRLWQKNLPKDTDPLKYPNRSGYQLGILNLQYSTSPATSNSQGSIGGSQ